MDEQPVTPRHKRPSTWVAFAIELVLLGGLAAVYLSSPKDDSYFWLAVIIFLALNLFLMLGRSAWDERQETNRG